MNIGLEKDETAKIPATWWPCWWTWGRLGRNLRVLRSIRDHWELNLQQRSRLLFLLRSSNCVWDWFRKLLFCVDAFPGWNSMPSQIKFWGVVQAPFIWCSLIQRRNSLSYVVNVVRIWNYLCWPFSQEGWKFYFHQKRDVYRMLPLKSNTILLGIFRLMT